MPKSDKTTKPVITAKPFQIIDKKPPPKAEQNQFSPFKILNYMDKLKNLAEGKDIVPVTVEIDPTNVCNHDCVWCISKEPRKNNDRLGLEKLENIIDELKAAGVRSVVFKGGGDPLVYRHINDIIYYTHKAGLRIGLETNGAPMTVKHMHAFVDCLDWVRISLDAATNKTHYAIHQGRSEDEHDKICNHIADLIKLREIRSSHLVVGINMSVHTHNYHEIVATCRLASELQCNYVSLRCVMPLYVEPAEEKILDLIETTFQQVKKMDFGQTKILGYFSRHQDKPYKNCVATPLSSVIGADGEVYICCHQRGFKDYSFGNIKEQSFEEIWNGERRKKILQKVKENHCSLEICGDRLDHYNTLVNYLQAKNKLHKEFI